MSKRDHSIRLAALTDLKYVVHLQRIWSNQVGFLPRAALTRYIDNRGTLLVRNNGQDAGYLSWQLTKKGLLRLIQIAVDPQLLREKLGSDVVTYIERAARAGACSVIRFQTRMDLDANLFWNDQGYTTTAVFQHPTARRRPLIEWTKCLLNPTILAEALLNRNKRYKHRKQFPIPIVKHPQHAQSNSSNTRTASKERRPSNN